MKKIIVTFLMLITTLFCLTALFSCEDKLTVAFSANGGVFEDGETEIKVELGKNLVVAEPKAPTREGYTFVGFSKDEDGDEPWDFESDIVLKNITLYAIWEKDSSGDSADGDLDAEKPDTETPDTETPDTDKPDTETPDEENPGEDKPDDETPDEDEPTLEIGSEIGNLAPSFDLERVGSEEKVNIKNYLGKIVVVNFWGTWCGPCIAELPGFDRVATEYKDDVVIIAAHSTYAKENAADYITENYPSSDIIFAYDRARDGYTDLYFSALGGTDYYPHTVIIDRDGVITYKKDSSINYDALKAEIEKYIDNSESDAPDEKPEENVKYVIALSFNAQGQLVVTYSDSSTKNLELPKEAKCEHHYIDSCTIKEADGDTPAVELKVCENCGYAWLNGGTAALSELELTADATAEPASAKIVGIAIDYRGNLVITYEDGNTQSISLPTPESCKHKNMSSCTLTEPTEESNGIYLDVCNDCGFARIAYEKRASAANVTLTSLVKNIAAANETKYIVDISFVGNNLVITFNDGTEAEISLPKPASCYHPCINHFAIKEHTAETNGIYLDVCDDCGYTWLKYETRHTWEFCGNVEPTCESEGYKLYTCVDCDMQERTDFVSKIEHLWDYYEITINGNVCEDGGIITYYCAYGCGTTMQEEIPPEVNSGIDGCHTVQAWSLVSPPPRFATAKTS